MNSLLIRRGKTFGLLKSLFGIFLVSVLAPTCASAHEAYVLTNEQWRAGYQDVWYDVLLPLRHSENASLVTLAAAGGLLLFVASYFFWRSLFGHNLSLRLWKAQPIAFLILRAAFAFALIIGAYNGAIFGPELSIDLLPYHLLVRYGLYGVAVLILLGWLTELSAIALIAAVALSIWSYGSYALVYFYYLLAALTLLIYGCGAYGLDAYLSKKETRSDYALPKPSALLRRDALTTTGFRLALGAVFVLGAIIVKFLHPAVSLQVAYSFGLFPKDPAFFVAGAALVELALGFFLLVGFQTRTVAAGALLMLMTAQIAFSEVLWPHLPVYGLALYLMLSGGGALTADHWLRESELKIEHKKRSKDGG